MSTPSEAETETPQEVVPPGAERLVPEDSSRAFDGYRRPLRPLRRLRVIIADLLARGWANYARSVIPRLARIPASTLFLSVLC